MDEEELHRLVSEYLQAVESGEIENPAQWLIRHPEHREALEAFFSEWDEVLREIAPLKEGLYLNMPGSTGSLTTDEEWVPVLYAPGSRFGNYELLHPLGHGGMGVVYRARQEHSGRIVALKMLRGEPESSPRKQRRFLNEVEILSELEHPHILPVFDVGDVNGRLYFTMRLAEGGNLVSRRDELVSSPERMVGLMIAIAEAVHFAHQHGALHRDIKPSNVLLDDSGHPYITDFGLARRVLQEGEHVTLPGELVGTPSYMAPEQAQSASHELTVSTDVHGLGATLYWLLTGKPPFEGDGVLETLNQVVWREPTPPRTLNPAIPLDLQSVCLKALNKKPEERYASAQDFADDLKHFLAGEPTVARPVSLARRVWHRGRKHPALMGLIAALSLFISLIILLLLAHNRRLDMLNEELATSLGRSRANRREAKEALYASTINLAAQAHRENEPRKAIQLLERYQPAEGEPDLRGFAWHFLYYRCHIEHRTVRAFPQDVYTIAVAPDGARMAVAGRDARIRLLSLPKLEPQAEWSTGQGEINHLCFSPDGNHLTSTGDDGTVRVHELLGRREVLRFSGRHRKVYQAHYSPDGRSLFVCGTDPGIEVRDAATGRTETVLKGHRRPVEALALSPDGRGLVSVSSDATAKLWDLVKREHVHTWEDHPDRLLCAGFSPDSTRVAVGGVGGLVRVYEVSSKRAILTGRHYETVETVLFLPEENRFLSGDRGGTIRMWQGGQSEPILVWEAHQERIWMLTCARKHRLVLAAGEGGHVRAWSLPDLEERLAIRTGELSVSDFAPLSEGKGLIVGNREGLFHWSPRREVLATLSHENHHARRLTASPRGTAVACADPEGELTLREVPKGEAFLRAPFGSYLRDATMAFSPDGETLALLSRSSPSRLIIMCTRNGRRLAQLTFSNAQALAYSPAGDHLAVSVGNEIHLLRTGTWRTDRILRGHATPIRQLAFSPDGRHLASVDEGRYLCLRLFPEDRLVSSIRAHRAPTSALAFHPNGDTFLSSADQGIIKAWDGWHGVELGALIELPLPTLKMSFLTPSKLVCLLEDQSLYFLNAGRDHP